MASKKFKGPKLSHARAYVIANAPYFRPALYTLIPTPIENLTALINGPMAVTNRMLLLYDPAWIDAAPVIEIASGIGHEIFHHLLHHISRGAAYPNPKKFNLAADLFINQAMRQQQGKSGPVWQLPEWAAFPEKYNLPLGKTADQYYHLLTDEDAQTGGGSGGSQAGGSGKGNSGDSKAKSNGDGGDGGKGKGQPGKVACGGCGGIAGNESPLEQGLNEANGRTEGEMRAARKETLHLITQEGGKNQGLFPGLMSEVLKHVEDRSLVPWQQHLQNIAGYIIGQAKSGGLDYSRARPSRRSYLRGWPIPGLVKREFTILIVLDTSGSMGKEQLKHALDETIGILKHTGCDNVYLLQVDAKVHGDPVKVTFQELENLTIKGRGGTSFVPAFAAAEKMHPRPDVIIYMTDGIGNAPENPPVDIHTIWCIVPTPYGQRPAKWGQLVVVSNDQKLRDPYGM
jgi:predicted metal-dependent peptidase